MLNHIKFAGAIILTNIYAYNIYTYMQHIYAYNIYTYLQHIYAYGVYNNKCIYIHMYIHHTTCK